MQKISISTVALILLFTTLIMPFRDAYAASNGSISLLPSITASVGQIFTTPVMIDTAGENIIGADLQIYFDKTVLELIDITPYPENSNLKDFLPVDFSVNPPVFAKTQIITQAKNTGVIEFSAITGPTDVFNGQLDELNPLARLQFKVLAGNQTSVVINHTPGSTVDSNLVGPGEVEVLSKVTNLIVNSIASPTPAPVKQISINNSSFTPNNLIVDVGDTITWTNNDSIPHTVTADINSAFTSGTLQPGQSYTITTGLPGVFAYHCNFHPTMTGTITTVSSSPQPSGSQKPGDIDGDEDVDIFDYNQLLSDFGKTGTNIQGDVDKNGKVDIFDYNILLTNFGG